MMSENGAFGDEEVFGDFEDLGTGEQPAAANLEGDKVENEQPAFNYDAANIDKPTRVLKIGHNRSPSKFFCFSVRA